MLRVAAIQMRSVDDVDQNLARAGTLLADAATDGCRLAVLPENFALMPKHGRDKASVAEPVGEGPIQAFLAETARQHQIWIIGGSIPLASGDSRRVFGGCPVIDDTGETRAMYRKIHLFDVDLADAGESYRESRSMVAGDELMVVDTPAGRLGLTICYDVRFPELFRDLVSRGATYFTVPAAFTETTGKAHWHVLLRARAIENLAYVIAPGQAGTHPDKRATYGHSLIVDPWGAVLSELADGEGFVAADIDPEYVRRLRTQFPALSNRKLT